MIEISKLLAPKLKVKEMKKVSLHLLPKGRKKSLYVFKGEVRLTDERHTIDLETLLKALRSFRTRCRFRSQT